MRSSLYGPDAKAESGFSLLIVTRDHEEFIEEALESALIALGPSTPVFVVDTGSEDGTLDLVRDFIGQRIPRAQLFSLARGSTVLDAMHSVASAVKTDYVALLSGDDALMHGYGAAIEVALRHAQGPTVVNCCIDVCDASMSHLRTQRPRWTRHSGLNRKLLLVTNPGLAPGAVIPWQLFLSKKITERHRGSLIEDYVLWWELFDSVEWTVLRTPLVRYRRHQSSLTQQMLSMRYAWSLGYCAGMARGMAHGPLEKFLARRLSSRWARKLDPTVDKEFRRGAIAGEAALTEQTLGRRSDDGHE